jgi:chromosome segregation ATPase
MQDRLERVETKIDALASVVTTLDGRVFNLEGKVSTLDHKVTRLDEKVSSIDDKVAQLGAKIDIQVEGLRELVQRTAEGYSATLDSMVRELADFRSEIRVKTSDTDLIVRDHERRITTLQQPPRT